jgi:hypothetical protein
VSAETEKVLNEVWEERQRQEQKWGEQNHPDGTGSLLYQRYAEGAKEDYEYAAKRGLVNWRLILHEEVYEAFAESDPAKLRTELLQVAAVATAWVAAIDRRGGK